MMRGIRRLAVCTAAIGLLSAVAVGVNIEMAHASSQVATCDGSSAETTTAYECDLDGSVSDASAITIAVSDDTSGYIESVYINWQVTCTDTTNGTLTTADAVTDPTPVTLDLTLPASADGTCTVDSYVESETGSLANCPASTVTPAPTPTPSPSPTPTSCPDDFNATLSFTSAATATATATATTSTVELVKGYSGMCLDDKGNSSSNGAKIIVWDCNSSDQAQSWNWTSNELRHNGKCINDTGDGGSGTHLILYTCGSAKNDKWTKSNGELKLQAHNGKLCLDDTGYSKKDGTQLIVYTCKGQSNEKWTVSS